MQFVFVCLLSAYLTSATPTILHKDLLRRGDGDDPAAVSDPLQAIICDPELPDFDYTTRVTLGSHAWYISNPTVARKKTLHLCAREDLGGLPGNVGGYCERNRRLPENVTFTVQSGSWQALFSHRLMAYCKTKCQCAISSDGEYPVYRVRWGRYRGPKRYLENGGPMRDIAGSLRNENGEIVFEHFELDRKTTIPKYGVSNSRMELAIKVVPEHQPPFVDIISYSIHPDNKIVCDATPLPVVFPTPGVLQDFSDNTDVCALALAGGNWVMNAGGYCHRSEDEKIADVWFTDEMTQLPSWTGWPAYNPNSVEFGKLWSLRAHCYSRCRCANPELHKRDPRNLGLIFKYLNLEFGRDDILNFPSIEGGPCGTTRSESGSCSSSQGYGAGGTSRTSSKCDVFCSNNQDCVSKSTSSCRYLPRCAVDPSSIVTSMVGKDLSAGAVLTYAVASCLTAQGRPRLFNLGGRALPEDPKFSWPCACNSSFVSRACCGSPGGVVTMSDSIVLGSLI